MQQQFCKEHFLLDIRKSAQYILHRPGENLEFESACAGKKQTDTIMRVSKVVADQEKLLAQFKVP